MNGQRIGCVVVMGLGLALAAPAAGQEPADTRSGEAAAARQAKAASPEQNDRSRLERVLNFVEHSPAIGRIFGTADGFGVRIGGIEDGPGFAFGPRWQATYLDGHIRPQVSGAADETAEEVN